MTSIGDYNNIMSDHGIFNQVVYTPLSEALRLLEERQNDPVLMSKISELLNGDIPEVLKSGKSGVQFRQIATPNHDARHFISITKDHDLKTVFFEYLDDKFTSNNEFKHSLGQLRIHGNVNKNDVYPIEKITIVDFNEFNGKKLKDVNTVWGESLLEFHRKLFGTHDYDVSDFFMYEASQWLKNNGGSASEYYKNFFLLFVCNGILFENFLLDDADGEFSKNVVLPAIDYVVQKTGVKPLIVPIGPLEIETDSHWICYSPNIKDLIPKK